MKTENRTAYPLAWPEGWPRTPRHEIKASRFRGSYASASRNGHSMARVRQELADELHRLGAVSPILSTNVELRLDGLPYSNRVSPTDCGAAVYFKLKGKDISLACDRWNRVEDNIWAITKKIYNIREDDRNGVGNVHQAFRGYMALAESCTGIDPWDILGLKKGVTYNEQQITSAYREKAKTEHPDVGGTHERFQRLRLAHDLAMATTRNQS